MPEFVFATPLEPTVDTMHCESIGVGATSPAHAAELGFDQPAAGLILDYRCGATFCLTGHRVIVPIDADTVAALVGMFAAWQGKALKPERLLRNAQLIADAAERWTLAHRDVDLDKL